MAVKTFSTGEVLTASDTNTYLNNGGLVLITSGITVSSSGGTAATVSNGAVIVGSGNTSITLAGAFSSIYDSYRIVVANVVASTESNVTFQFAPSSVSGYNSSYGGALMYTTWSAGGYLDARDNSNTKFSYIGNTQASAGSFAFDVNNPFNTKYSSIGPCGWNSGGGSGTYNGIHQQNQSYTGFTIAPTSGSWTSGTISVYGYRKA